MPTELYDQDGNVVTVTDTNLLPGIVQNVVYGTRVFALQDDGRYVESTPGSQPSLPAIYLPTIRRNEDPAF